MKLSGYRGNGIEIVLWQHHATGRWTGLGRTVAAPGPRSNMADSVTQQLLTGVEDISLEFKLLSDFVVCKVPGCQSSAAVTRWTRST